MIRFLGSRNVLVRTPRWHYIIANAWRQWRCPISGSKNDRRVVRKIAHWADKFSTDALGGMLWQSKDNKVNQINYPPPPCTAVDHSKNQIWYAQKPAWQDLWQIFDRAKYSIKLLPNWFIKNTEMNDFTWIRWEGWPFHI